MNELVQKILQQNGKQDTPQERRILLDYLIKSEQSPEVVEAINWLSKGEETT